MTHGSSNCQDHFLRRISRSLPRLLVALSPISPQNENTHRPKPLPHFGKALIAATVCQSDAERFNTMEKKI
jgi:hypothetical protein